MSGFHCGKLFLYGGIDRDDYNAIRPLVRQRNLKSLRITASLAAGIGALFLLINTFLRSGTQTPYLILLGGSLLTLCLLPLVRKKGGREICKTRGRIYCPGFLSCSFSINPFYNRFADTCNPRKLPYGYAGFQCLLKRFFLFFR